MITVNWIVPFTYWEDKGDAKLNCIEAAQGDICASGVRTIPLLYGEGTLLLCHSSYYSWLTWGGEKDNPSTPFLGVAWPWRAYEDTSHYTPVSTGTESIPARPLCRIAHWTCPVSLSMSSSALLVQGTAWLYICRWGGEDFHSLSVIAVPIRTFKCLL